MGLLAVLSLGVLYRIPFRASPTRLMPRSACIAGIMKITVLPSLGRSQDFLYDTTGLAIWATAELNVGILAASIPCLKPLYRIVLEKSGYVPKYNPAGMPDFSNSIPNLGVRSSDVYRNDSQMEEGESGVDMKTFGETELVKPPRVYFNDSSKESLLQVHGSGIVKATQVEVRSVEKGRTPEES